MSDTPRTDAECGWYDPNGVRYPEPTGDHVDPDFARDLERELNAAKARADRLESVLLSRHGGECIQLIDELDAWRVYAASVEGFVESNAARIDAERWSALKAGRPSNE